MKTKLLLASCIVAASIAAPAAAESSRQNGLTAQDQSNGNVQAETTRRIRSSIGDDKSLSTSAKNITVITTGDGMVTLKGEVENTTERQRVETLAKQVAGDKVNDELEVKVNEGRGRLAD